jgi:hypothetical protein
MGFRILRALEGCYTQWVKEANPSLVLKHKQCRDSTTSEPGTLNLEPLSLGLSLQAFQPDSDSIP